MRGRPDSAVASRPDPPGKAGQGVYLPRLRRTAPVGYADLSNRSRKAARYVSAEAAWRRVEAGALPKTACAMLRKLRSDFMQFHDNAYFSGVLSPYWGLGEERRGIEGITTGLGRNDWEFRKERRD